MAEIMTRMAEQKQIAVQAAERKLCERLNDLAAALTATADAADASRGLPTTPRSANGAVAGGGPGANGADGDADGAGPSSGRRRKRKKLQADGESVYIPPWQ